MKIRFLLAFTGLVATVASAESALAVSSAELYTSQSYQYGRFEAGIRFAPGSGVVSSFFLWKDGSEISGTFWNELDIEKLDADCHLQTNALFGDPPAVHVQSPSLTQDLCGEYHSYAYEWTPEYIAWFVDDVEVRRETGETATAFSENATAGMQLRFNIWPGNASFGGVFDPNILPVYQYIDWVQYSAYVDGAFELEWREDFDAGVIPSGWLIGSWGSPKNLSTHSPENVGVVDGYVVLALTADDALGMEGASPEGPSPMLGGGDTAGDSSGCSFRVAPARGGTTLALTLLLGFALVGGTRRLSRGTSASRRIDTHHES